MQIAISYMLRTKQVEPGVNKKMNLNHNYSDRDRLFDSLIDGSYKIRTATVLFRDGPARLYQGRP